MPSSSQIASFDYTNATGTGFNVLANSPTLNNINVGFSRSSDIGVRFGGTFTGLTGYNMVWADPTIGSTATSGYTGFTSRPGYQNATFTAANVVHFYAVPQARPASVTISAQYGFLAEAGMGDSSISYGFYSGIATGNNRYAVYTAGSAQSYFGGAVSIGSIPASGAQALNVNGAVRVAAITSANQTSAGTMDFTGGNLRFLCWGASGTQGVIQWLTGAGNSGATVRMTLNGSNNLGLATATFGTNATNTLSIASGTAPASGVADTVQYYSMDLSAGNTMPAFYTEGTNVGTGTPTANRTIAVNFNGTTYYLLASTTA